MEVLKDHKGKLSSTRVMSWMSFVISCIFGYLTFKTGNPSGLEITVAFLVGGFAPKAVQSFAEHQGGIK